jgi:hypothetical protein
VRLTHDQGGVALYGPKEYATLCAEVDRLYPGICDDKAEQFINERKPFSEFSRSGQKTHLDGRPELKDRLKARPR